MPIKVVYKIRISVEDDTKDTKRSLYRDPWVKKYGYIGNPTFMREAKEYNNWADHPTYNGKTKRTRGFIGGKTYVWEVDEVIEFWYQEGLKKQFNGRCEYAPVTLNIDSRAPWMDIAISEAINYGGVKGRDSEKVQERIVKYHKEGDKYNTDLYTQLWCASFASWCLKGAEMPNPSTAGSLAFLSSSKLEKCDVFYAAIAVFEDCDINGNKIIIPTTQKTHYGGHVTFIYGKITEYKYAVLGGNQGSMIKVSTSDCSGNIFHSFSKTYTLKDKTEKKVDFYKRFKGFFKPKGYVITEK